MSAPRSRPRKPLLDVQRGGGSSVGPTDDGRIKPDIVAPGVLVFTTNDGSGSQTWVHDLERGVSDVRISRDDGSAISLFFPDGRIGVTPVTTGVGTFVYPPSGKGDPELLDGPIWEVSPDGKVFVTSEWSLPGESPYSMSGPGVEGGQRLLLSGEHGELFNGLSNDGAWMLHSSKRTGAMYSHSALPLGQLMTTLSNRAWTPNPNLR